MNREKMEEYREQERLTEESTNRLKDLIAKRKEDQEKRKEMDEHKKNGRV